jgi:hypothetical protein
MHLQNRCKIVVVICALSYALDAQSNYLLDYFKAFATGEKIELIWQMGKGNQCSGIGIHRSTDGFNFEKISEIPGICGSDTSAQFYSFTDESPLPGRLHHYVLELGFAGKTDPPITIYYPDFSEKSIQVIPNPLSGLGIIAFPNPDGDEHQIFLYDASGQFLYKGHTREEYFALDVQDLNVSISGNGGMHKQVYFQIRNVSSRAQVGSGNITFLVADR